MTRFRFDAILWIGSRSTPHIEIPFLDPPPQGWNRENVQALLAAGKSDGIGLARIPNSRVARDLRVLAQLGTPNQQQPLSALRKELDSEPAGIHPEEIIRLAAEAGYKAILSWASCYPDGSYDAAFIRSGASEDCAFPAILWPQPGPAAYVYQSNAPGQSEIRQKLIAELLTYGSARLRNSSIPAELHLVDSLPRTEDNSAGVDFEALLSATQAAGAF